MKLASSFTKIVLVCLIASVDISAGWQSNRTELEGVWNGVKSSVGDAVRMFKPGEVKLVFEGGKLVATGLVGRGATATVEFRIDSSHEPKEFDFTRKPGDVAECIYELNGDELKIAVPRSTSKRPSQFDHTSRELIILILHRQK